MSAQNWNSVSANSFEWQVFNFFDVAIRWSVLIFIMISGTLFLNKDILITKIYFKYILQMVISFFVLSLIYAIWVSDEKDFKNKFLMLIDMYHHIRFILMMIGIVLVIEKLNMDRNLNTLCFNPVFSVIFISFIVFIIFFYLLDFKSNTCD